MKEAFTAFPGLHEQDRGKTYGMSHDQIWNLRIIAEIKTIYLHGNRGHNMSTCLTSKLHILKLVPECYQYKAYPF